VVVGYPHEVIVFVEPARLVAGTLVLTGDEHHYVAHVRRARPGVVVTVVDGAGRSAQATVETLTDAETALRVAEPTQHVQQPPHVRFLLPLIKGERMDDALGKLVEVGVDAIVVWPADRSVVKLDPERRESRLAKYASALQAAARQCRRPYVPSITYADSLGAAISALPFGGARFVLDLGSSAPLASLEGIADVTIASGPEGDLTRPELALMAANQFVAVGLGPRILRAETAPVVAVALVRNATQS
jgi:16S rRNA (uracil1498-N3)-methyltransferase